MSHDLYQHLLDMLGAKDHADAGRIIGELHAKELAAAPPAASVRAKEVTNLEIATAFHEAYERLAPRYGYETRPESRKPFSDLPNELKLLMVAVVREVRTLLAPAVDERAASSEPEMCPNCVTPWKCNGPHEFPQAASSEAASFDQWDVVPQPLYTTPQSSPSEWERAYHYVTSRLPLDPQNRARDTTCPMQLAEIDRDLVDRFCQPSPSGPVAKDVDLCEVARELERVAAEKAIRGASWAVINMAPPFRMAYWSACEEIAERIGVPYTDPDIPDAAAPVPPAHDAEGKVDDAMVEAAVRSWRGYIHEEIDDEDRVDMRAALVAALGARKGE